MTVAENITFRPLAQSRASPEQVCEGLNDEQLAAVTAGDEPLLILAGAGTGKTRALATRIAFLLASGRARPQEMLSVTFTNKAAREMGERVQTLLARLYGEGAPAAPLRWLGTFHSLSARMLRSHAELVGLTSSFTILDTDDQLRLLKQILQAANIDDKRWPARSLLALIDRWKNNNLAPADLSAEEGALFANGRGAKLYQQYQARLQTLNAADFGDLIMHVVKIWQAHPDVLAQYHDRLRHILVDEYQDTNTAQYLWLRLLAQKHKCLSCVGDDDQSIYGWRGAQVSNMLNFAQDFPGAHIVRLERNYRSTQNILHAANGLIGANHKRLGKNLWTQSPPGEKVRCVSMWDGDAEARQISDEIEALQNKKHLLNEIAILVRSSAQMRAFEDRFIICDIPYRVIGGPRFYERLEIRDANAYLRLLLHAEDDLAFERICNRPRRGLGIKSLQTLHRLARAQNCSLSAAAEQACDSDELPPRARTSLTSFLRQLARWRALGKTMEHARLAELVLDESGYTAMWQADKSADAPGRLDNLKECVRSMEAFGSLADYLEHIALVMEAEQDAGAARVSLMTMHAAKGLEFDTVFLPGWEEGLFPHQRALQESGEAALEEERRLAYVGLTRARLRAQISFANSRRLHGLWQAAAPSRFIDELPRANCDMGDVAPPQAAQVHELPRPRKSPRAERAAPRAAFQPAAVWDLHERVFHQKFGYGTIQYIDGEKLTIDFEKAGRKKVLDNFVQKPDSL